MGDRWKQSKREAWETTSMPSYSPLNSPFIFCPHPLSPIPQFSPVNSFPTQIYSALYHPHLLLSYWIPFLPSPFLACPPPPPPFPCTPSFCGPMCPSFLSTLSTSHPPLLHSPFSYPLSFLSNSSLSTSLSILSCPIGCDGNNWVWLEIIGRDGKQLGVMGKNWMWLERTGCDGKQLVWWETMDVMGNNWVRWETIGCVLDQQDVMGGDTKWQ